MSRLAISKTAGIPRKHTLIEKTLMSDLPHFAPLMNRAMLDHFQGRINRV